MIMKELDFLYFSYVCEKNEKKYIDGGHPPKTIKKTSKSLAQYKREHPVPQETISVTF